MELTVTTEVDGKTYIGTLRERKTTIKPKPKKIDMSVCIESGIDCEFWDNDCPIPIDYTIAKIKDMEVNYDNCRPRMNGHIHASPTGWDKCPLPEGFTVIVWDRYGHRTNWATNDCSLLKWENVAMFQVAGITKGWEL